MDMSFSYTVLMRPRNTETMIPSDNTRGLMFPTNLALKLRSTGNFSSDKRQLEVSLFLF